MLNECRLTEVFMSHVHLEKLVHISVKLLPRRTTRVSVIDKNNGNCKQDDHLVELGRFLIRNPIPADRFDFDSSHLGYDSDSDSNTIFC